MKKFAFSELSAETSESYAKIRAEEYRRESDASKAALAKAIIKQDERATLNSPDLFAVTGALAEILATEKDFAQRIMLRALTNPGGALTYLLIQGAQIGRELAAYEASLASQVEVATNA
jgi:hypothetical protein